MLHIFQCIIWLLFFSFWRTGIFCCLRSVMPESLCRRSYMNDFGTQHDQAGLSSDARITLSTIVWTILGHNTTRQSQACNTKTHASVFTANKTSLQTIYLEYWLQRLRLHWIIRQSAENIPNVYGFTPRLSTVPCLIWWSQSVWLASHSSFTHDGAFRTFPCLVLCCYFFTQQIPWSRDQIALQDQITWHHDIMTTWHHDIMTTWHSSLQPIHCTRDASTRDPIVAQDMPLLSRNL